MGRLFYWNRFIGALATLCVGSSCNLQIRGNSAPKLDEPADTTPPTLAITSPATNTFVIASNYTAWTVSGTCSENGRTVSISTGGGAVTASPVCLAGAWTTNLNLTAISDGAFTVLADHADAAGNNATQASRSFNKDIAIPTTTIASPANGAFITIANQASFSVSGSCSENGRAVGVLFGDGTNFQSSSPTCTAGSYSTTLNLTSLNSGSIQLNLNHSDVAGNAATEIIYTFTKDVTAPTVAITSPAANSYANASNYTAWTVSGTCSENGRTVSVSAGGGAVTASPVCSAGAWTTNLNLTAISDGAFTVLADHSDAAGNNATQDSRTFTKDIVSPAIASVTVANISPTSLRLYSLVFGTISGPYSDYCFRENSTSSASCTWITGTIPTTYTVSNVNESKALSVFLRDLAGNVSVVATSNSVTFNGSLSLSPSSFTLTSTQSSNYLETSRFFHESVELADGKILITGGAQDSNGAYAQRGVRSTLIYDPVADRYSSAGPLHYPRSHFRLHRLSSGKVIAAGGIAWASATATVVNAVEIYDPLTRKWNRVSNLPAPRARYGSSIYFDSNGKEKLLLTGGINASVVAVTSVYIYDVETDTWTTSSNPLPESRADHGQITLPNGNVLIAGGADTTPTNRVNSRIFNHINTTWSGTTAMPTWHVFSRPVLVRAADSGLGSDRVYMIGGSQPGGGSAQQTMSIYDVTAGTWSAGSTTLATHGETVQPVVYKPAAGFAKLIVIGGTYAWDNGGVLTNRNNRIEVYDTNTGGAWAYLTNIPTTITSHSVAFSSTSNKVHVFGGRNVATSEFTGGYVYDPVANSWNSRHAEGLRRREDASSIKLLDGRVLTCGGKDTGTTTRLSSCALFDPTTNAVYPAARLTTARWAAKMALIEGGRVLIAGGFGADNATACLNSTEIYDPATNTWTAGPTMASKRAYFSMVALDPVAGKVPVLVVSGYDYDNIPNRESIGSEVYYDGTFTATPALPGGERWRTTVHKLTGSTAMLIGGIGPAGISSAVVIYDYSNNTWTSKAGLNTPRAAHISEVLSNGRIVVAGGYDYIASGAVATTEEYDPVGDTWTLTNNIPFAVGGREEAVSVRLANDQVLVLGGRTSNLVSLYSPSLGTWAASTTLNQARNDNMPAVLLDDQSRIVLLGGGANNWLTAEVYQLTTAASFTSGAFAPTTSGGDQNYTYTKTSGPGTIYDLMRIFYPPYPLTGGPTQVQVQDGNGNTANYTINF